MYEDELLDNDELESDEEILTDDDFILSIFDKTTGIAIYDEEE